MIESHLITLTAQPKSFKQNFKTNKHLFSVVVNDGNKDKVVDKKDTTNLRASACNGLSLLTVAKDINDFKVVDDNVLMITQHQEDKAIITTYNLETGTSNILNTRLPATEAP